MTRLLRIGIITIVVFVSAASVTAFGQQPLCGPDRDPLIDQLIDYLGFETSHRDALVYRGEIVHTGMVAGESLPEELAVAGVMLIVERPIEETVEVYLDDESFRTHQGVAKHGALPEGADEAGVRAALAGAGLEGDESAEARLMVASKAGGKLNLSSHEFTRFAALDPRDPVLVAEASTVYREILADRFLAFRDDGLGGIEPYDRGGKKRVSPSLELTSAIESMHFLNQHFPDFGVALRHSAGSHDTTNGHRDFWIKKTMDGRPLFALSHQVIVEQPGYAIAGDIQFFVGHSYNSMLTVIGAAACGPNTLVVAVNHTFTDQVTGFGSSVKKKIGRNKVAEEMARHFEVLRTSLHARP
jgi:hypothetical protein